MPWTARRCSREAWYTLAIAGLAGPVSYTHLYLLNQRGMFSYTGLSAAQVDQLREEFGVYLIASGRMCVAGLNTANVQCVAKAFAAVM